ncbi:MAG: DUF937 domain-containing protein [Bacteroidia bacterium]
MAVLENVLQHFSGPALSALSQQLGTDENQAQSALQSALPLIVSALAQNSSQTGGASALSNALDRDHDGSILDDVLGFVTNSQGGSSIGMSILKHVLGGEGEQKRSVAEQAVSQSSGLNMSQVGTLLSFLAPVVLGYLGKTKQQNGLDESGLAGLLSQEKQAQSEQGGLIGTLTNLLDSNNDGNLMDDIGGLIGKFMK